MVFIQCKNCIFLNPHKNENFVGYCLHHFPGTRYVGLKLVPGERPFVGWPRVSEISGCGDGVKKQNK